MLSPVPATDYDLRFSLFGIPVRVHPLFWVASVVMGWVDGRLDLVLVWLACVFVSILVHEMGHALAARSFGWSPEVVLYLFGGLASFIPTQRYTAGRAIAVSAAGPAAGFLLYGCVLAFDAWRRVQGVELSELGAYALFDLEFINLWWGLVNLLPVLPLDGGQISRDLLGIFRHDGLQLAVQLSVVVAGGVAAWCFMHEETYPALLFAVLCVNNIQMLQAGGRGW